MTYSEVDTDQTVRRIRKRLVLMAVFRPIACILAACIALAACSVSDSTGSPDSAPSERPAPPPTFGDEPGIAFGDEPGIGAGTDTDNDRDDDNDNDNDNDGIPNSLDDDIDGDDVANELDLCPGQPGIDEYGGCRDVDAQEEALTSSALDRCRATASKLLDAQMVFEPVIEMALGDSHTVEAVVTRDTARPASEVLPGTDAVRAVQVSVPCRVEARLDHAPGEFEVTPGGYSEQFVVAGSDARWTWLVKPRKQGTLALALSVRGVLEDTNGDLTTTPVTEEVEIAAHVSGAALILDAWLDQVNEGTTFGLVTNSFEVDRSQQTSFTLTTPGLAIPDGISPVPGDRIKVVIDASANSDALTLSLASDTFYLDIDGSKLSANEMLVPTQAVAKHIDDDFAVVATIKLSYERRLNDEFVELFGSASPRTSTSIETVELRKSIKTRVTDALASPLTRFLIGPATVVGLIRWFIGRRNKKQSEEKVRTEQATKRALESAEEARREAEERRWTN